MQELKQSPTGNHQQPSKDCGIQLSTKEEARQTLQAVLEWTRKRSLQENGTFERYRYMKLTEAISDILPTLDTPTQMESSPQSSQHQGSDHPQGVPTPRPSAAQPRRSTQAVGVPM